MKIQAKHDRLRRRIENAEGNAVQTADQRIKDGRKPTGHFFRQEHGHAPEDGPDIKIRNPPCVKAREKSVEHHVNVNGDQCLYAEHKGVGHGQHSQQVNIRKRLHDHLGAEHQRAEHGEDGDLRHGQPCPSFSVVTWCRQGGIPFLR